MKPDRFADFCGTRTPRKSERLWFCSNATSGLVGAQPARFICPCLRHDSRRLPAYCLDRGMKPGSRSWARRQPAPTSLMARAIWPAWACACRSYCLDPHRLPAPRCPDCGHLGRETAVNWHTYLYHLGKGFRVAYAWSAAMARFARSFFFDKPRFDPLAGMRPPWHERLLVCSVARGG